MRLSLFPQTPEKLRVVPSWNTPIAIPLLRQSLVLSWVRTIDHALRFCHQRDHRDRSVNSQRSNGPTIQGEPFEKWGERRTNQLVGTYFTPTRSNGSPWIVGSLDGWELIFYSEQNAAV
jgi:hypothetical protein